jgi:hypothetical protein
MKELTNKQKLEVLEETQRNYRGSFLCHKIAQKAYVLRRITSSEYGENEDSMISQTLIPELLQFKPRWRGKDVSWFGPAKNPESTAKRTQVLKDLIEMISQKEG